MLPAGGFICIVYFTIFKWLSIIKKKSKYPGPIFYFLYPIGEASVLGFYAAIATIDGNGLPHIHTIGATFFFVSLFIITFTVTITMRDIHRWDSSIINLSSVKVKITFILYLFANVIYFFYGMIK